jgi:hypothetical protein
VLAIPVFSNSDIDTLKLDSTVELNMNPLIVDQRAMHLFQSLWKYKERFLITFEQNCTFNSWLTSVWYEFERCRNPLRRCSGRTKLEDLVLLLSKLAANSSFRKSKKLLNWVIRRWTAARGEHITWPEMPGRYGIIKNEKTKQWHFELMFNVEFLRLI